MRNAIFASNSGEFLVNANRSAQHDADAFLRLALKIVGITSTSYTMRTLVYNGRERIQQGVNEAQAVINIFPTAEEGSLTELLQTCHPVTLSTDEIIDMAAFLSSDSTKTETRYQLTSFFTHIGGPEGGHYITGIRDSHGGWILYNDDNVHPLDPDEVKTQLESASSWIFKKLMQISNRVFIA